MNALAKRLARRANMLLTPTESVFGGAGVFRNPVLIVGPPRSGTTLLYQLMTQALEVAYLSNVHHALFGAPVLVESFVPRRLRRPPQTFQSRHGVSKGLWAPSEAANFWYRFFPRKPHAVGPSGLSVRDGSRMRRAVVSMSRSAGAPVLFKNVVCSVRLEAISRYLPEMRYVVMHRDEFDVASSIWIARIEANRSASDWWSVEPENVDELRELPPERQIVGQIRGVEQAISRARASIGSDRFADVDYAALTANPTSEVDRLSDALQIPRREGSRVLPEAFPFRSAANLNPEVAARLKETLSR